MFTRANCIAVRGCTDYLSTQAVKFILKFLHSHQVVAHSFVVQFCIPVRALGKQQVPTVNTFFFIGWKQGDPSVGMSWNVDISIVDWHVIFSICFWGMYVLKWSNICIRCLICRDGNGLLRTGSQWTDSLESLAKVLYDSTIDVVAVCACTMTSRARSFVLF